jgi:hypothetical protein
MAASTTAFVKLFLFSFGVSEAVDIVVAEVGVKVGVLGSALLFITAPGFKSGL